MKRVVLYLGLASCAGITYAQTEADSAAVKTDTTIRRDVEVVKEYTPVIKEAGKIHTMPELKDVNTKKINVDYRIWSSTFKPKADVIPTLDYALASQEENAYSKEGYLRIGAGNYASFLGELYTPIYKSELTLLDFYLKHNSSFGNVELRRKEYPVLAKKVKSKGLINDNKAHLSYLRSIKKKEISAFGEFGYDRFNYYGLSQDMIDYVADNVDAKELKYKDDSQKQSHMTAALNFRFRSKEYLSHWKYDFQTNYKLLKTKTDVKEHTIYTDLKGSYMIREESYFSLLFEMYNVFLGTPDSTSGYFFDKAENFGNFTVIKFNPYYTLSSEVGTLNLGLKAAFGIKQGRKGSINPDIFGKVRVIEDYWYVYAGITGDYEVNTLRDLAEENLYTTPTVRPEDTYIPVDVYLGTKVNAFKTVNMDFHIGYKIVNNPYFYVNRMVDGKMSNTFDIVYDKNVGNFTCGAAVNYNWKKKVDLSYKVDYSRWILDKQAEAWMKPTLEMEAGVNYIATDYLRFNVNYNLTAGRKALVGKETVEMKNFNDLSLGANYKLMSFMDIFARFNNILNQRYEILYGYPAQRFNFLLGLTLTF